MSTSVGVGRRLELTKRGGNVGLLSLVVADPHLNRVEAADRFAGTFVDVVDAAADRQLRGGEALPLHTKAAVFGLEPRGRFQRRAEIVVSSDECRPRLEQGLLTFDHGGANLLGLGG